MEQNFKLHSGSPKNGRERKSLFSESSSMKDQGSSFLSDYPKATALKDLNAFTKEKLSALENAQRKWMDDMRHCSTADEIQKAQLEWIQKISAFPSFSTISSPEKKKDTVWTLPSSSPQSSTDMSRRRGYCVYVPGIKDNLSKKITENISEHINDVKIAQLPEPAKVPFGNNATSLKSTISSSFSPFADSRSSKISKFDRSTQKRHITVRKKLQCQKKLELNEPSKAQQIIEPTANSKSAGNTPEKSEEERRAARKYIHRKRVERERQLREQKEQEEKAELEQRARMERLKETQHRILANSLRKPSKPKKEGWVGLLEQPQEDKPLSREMLEPPDYSGAHITGAIPFLSSRSRQSTPAKDSKSSPRATSTAEIRWTQDENVPPPTDDRWDSVSLDIKEVKGVHLLPPTRLSSPTKLSTSSGRPSSGSTIPENLKEYSLQKPSTPILSASPVHSKSSSRELSVVEVTPLASEIELFAERSLSQGHPPVINDFDQPEKLEDDLKKMLSFSPQSKKNDFALNYEKPTVTFEKNYPLFSTSTNFFADNQYNMLAAISNKRLAYKELENESLRKELRTYPNFDITSQVATNNLLSPDNFCSNKTNETKKVDDKGIQCQVDAEELHYASSTTDQLGSVSSCSDVKLTQSERLRKPNVVLFPGRVSDPYVYCRTKESHNDVRMDTTVSENLSIDPLNISGKMSLVPRQNVDCSNKINKDYPVPESFSKVEHSDFCTATSGEQEEKFRSLEMNINLKSHRKVSHINERLSEATKSEKSIAVSSQENSNHIGRKFEAEVKRLDLFDNYIKAALGKYNDGKNNQRDDLSKLSFNDQLDITFKNYNMSDVSLVDLRDTSMAKSTSTQTSSDKLSNQFDVKQSNIGIVGFAKFSLNMFIDLLKEESLKNKQQESYFKMRETSIIDKTKAEIAYLELEKKKFKLMGNEDGVRNLRKKIRGLIMKLQQNLEDLQLVKKMEKVSYRGRRRLLLEKIDLMRHQMKKQMEYERKAKKELVIDTSHSSIESVKEPIFLESLERRKTVPVIVENQKRIGESEENRLSWKQKLEEGERRIQELEELIKHSPFGKDMKHGKTVERGTSPLQLSSDEDRKKGEGSYSDTFDQLSTSSQHEKLENKDARKMIALKIPLSPRVTLKRRHSSGSDESLLLSQAETQSDASDMETRVLALQQQLKQRKAELESLHREYKKSQRERLIAKEQSLLSQIQAYDMYIGQVKKELEKEKDGTEVKIVKPVIKHPKLSCERRKSDTWLLQEKKCLKTSSRPISSNSCELVKSKEQVDKNLVDDKFLDNKELEKFTLKTDLLLEVGDSIRLQHDDQFVSTIEGIADLKNDTTSSVNLVSQTNDEDKPLIGTTIEEKIDFYEDKPFIGTTIEEKIDFYEKLSETSYTSVDTNAETVSSQSKTKKTSLVKDITSKQGVQSHEQRLAPITIDSGGAEELSIFSMPELKHSPEPADIEETNEKKNLSNYGFIKEEKGMASIEKVELIKVDGDISSYRDSDHISLENIEVNEDVTSVVITEIDENLSNDITLEIPINKDSRSTHSYLKDTEDYSVKEDTSIKEETSIIIEEISTKEEDTIKEEESNREVSELLSEVAGTLGSRGGSVREEISELLSLSKVNDASSDTVAIRKSKETEEVFSESSENKNELSENEMEEVEKSVQRSLSKKEQSIEDEVSSINSEELSSSASFPLPTSKNKTVEISHLNNSCNNYETVITNEQNFDSEIGSAVSEATLQEKQPSSVAEEISNVQDISNGQPIVESEIESGVSENTSMEKQLSSVEEEVDSSKSTTEEIKTELSKEQEIRSDVEESLKQLITEQLNSISSEFMSYQLKQSVSEEVEEAFDLDRSITESLVDASLAEDQEDSLEEDINRVLMKTKIIEHDDGCDSGNSFMDDKEMYNLINDEKREGGAGAPLIDALQREGDSAIDQVWRGIADSAVNDATELVISTFFNKATGVQSTGNNKLVGDSDEDELDGEALQRQQAAEAEVLRLQQLRIDKEIEELEEEEARRYYYIRPIPDKPPPPYTPRRSSLVASVVEAAGEIWDGRTEAPATFMAGCHLREFLWDLAAELVVRVRPSTPPPQPSWIHIRRRRPKRHIRTKEDLLEEVEKEAKIYLGVEERECRENLIIRWSRKRRDHVDEILVKESQEEEWEWTDYSEEENIIKNRIADAIIQESIMTATAAIAQAFTKKFKE